MEQPLAADRSSEKSLRMTYCIECPDCGCWPPSFEGVEPDETTLFVTGMPSAQERVKRNASGLRSSDGKGEINLPEFGFAEPVDAPGMILMRPASKAAVALH